MGIGASNSNKSKPYKYDATFCIICYENDIQCQRLVCGHAFCLDCILSINDYEDSPRCPLCRHFIQINYAVEKEQENGFNWFTIGRVIANCSAILISCFLFCYNILPHILPTMRGCFQDWDLTVTNMYGFLSDFRLEYGRAKENWF